VGVGGGRAGWYWYKVAGAESYTGFTRSQPGIGIPCTAGIKMRCTGRGAPPDEIAGSCSIAPSSACRRKALSCDSGCAIGAI
jgi:hypothetical protein